VVQRHRLRCLKRCRHHQPTGQDHRGQLHRFPAFTGGCCLGSDGDSKVQNAMELGQEQDIAINGTGRVHLDHLPRTLISSKFSRFRSPRWNGSASQTGNTHYRLGDLANKLRFNRPLLLGIDLSYGQVAVVGVR